MNRLSTYLTSQKLAKMHLHEAELAFKKGETLRAIGNLVYAVREFQTSTNALASLAFEPRKKRRAVAS